MVTDCGCPTLWHHALGAVQTKRHKAVLTVREQCRVHLVGGCANRRGAQGLGWRVSPTDGHWTPNCPLCHRTTNLEYFSNHLNCPDFFLIIVYQSYIKCDISHSITQQLTLKRLALYFERREQPPSKWFGSKVEFCGAFFVVTTRVDWPWSSLAGNIFFTTDRLAFTCLVW